MASDELRLRGVKSLKAELKVIAKNSGVSLSAYLKPKLREIINACPESMRIPRMD